MKFSYLLIFLFLPMACSGGTDPSQADVPRSDRPRTSGPPPTIRFEKEQSRSALVPEILDLDLGSMFQHQTTELRFPFEVQGDDSVKVTNLLASCGCTDVYLEVGGESWDLAKPIPGGAQGAVVGTFNSRDYVDRKTSSITLEGNATNFPLRMSLHAMVQPVFSVLPRQAKFAGILSGKLRRNPNPSRKLQVTGFQPFEILRWVDLPDWVRIEDLGETVANPDGGETHTLEILLDPETPEGRYSTIAIGETSLGHQVTFQVYAELYGKVRYFPNRLVGFNLVEQGKDPRRMMRIAASVDWLEVPSPKVSFEPTTEHGDLSFDVIFDEREAGKRWEIIVQLTPEAPLGRQAGNVLVSWPEESGIQSRTFPISALVRAASP